MVKDRNNQGHYSISGGQLSVSGHDGLWQCTPYNDIGNGQSANINITVYGMFFPCIFYFIKFYVNFVLFLFLFYVIIL